MIEPGHPAPDFTLPDQDGNEVSLASLRGQRVLLAFYPLDFSPVCTDQLNVYQEVLGELQEQEVKLLGISVDSAFSHKAFQDKQGLTIPLLADFHPKGEVSRRYGAGGALSELVRPQAVDRLVDEHRRGRADHKGVLYCLLELSEWHRAFVEAREPAPA